MMLYLHMAGTKQWFDISITYFERRAKKADFPWVAIKSHLLDVVTKAREQWPSLL